MSQFFTTFFLLGERPFRAVWKTIFEKMCTGLLAGRGGSFVVGFAQAFANIILSLQKKQVMKNLSGIQMLSAALAVFFATGICLISCKKEIAGEECKVVETSSTEAYDVVAYLDPFSQTLWVDPQYREIALSELGAHPVDNSYYKMSSITLSGHSVTARFRVMELAVPYVYLQSLAISGDVVSTFEIQGVPHRVVKNRTKDCHLFPGTTTKCVANADSTSTHTVYYDWSTCSYVNDEFKTCNQRKVVGGREVTYLSTNCTGGIKKEKPLEIWQCY